MNQRIATRRSIFYKMNKKTIGCNILLPYLLCLLLASLLLWISDSLDRNIKGFVIQRTVVVYSTVQLPQELIDTVESVDLFQEVDGETTYMAVLGSHKSVLPFIEKYTQDGIRITAYESSDQEKAMEFDTLIWFQKLLSIINILFLGIACILLGIMTVRELDMEHEVRANLRLLSFSKAQLFYFHMTVLFRVLLYGVVLVMLLSLTALVLQRVHLSAFLLATYAVLSLPLIVLYPLGAIKKTTRNILS